MTKTCLFYGNISPISRSGNRNIVLTTLSGPNHFVLPRCTVNIKHCAQVKSMENKNGSILTEEVSAMSRKWKLIYINKITKINESENKSKPVSQ